MFVLFFFCLVLAGCVTGFSPAYNASKCFKVFNQGRSFYPAEAECYLLTGYDKGISEIRTQLTKDFILTLMSGLTTHATILRFLKNNDSGLLGAKYGSRFRLFILNCIP